MTLGARFQHTAARRRLHSVSLAAVSLRRFQHTAARRRLLIQAGNQDCASRVSTHSRPKAAAFFKFGIVCMTQFQHTAARRRLRRAAYDQISCVMVSTHSRPKAAAQTWKFASPVVMVSTHSRPKAAAISDGSKPCYLPRFNTQPPEGGCEFMGRKLSMEQWFQHTAARRRLPSQVDNLNKWINVSTHSRPKAAACGDKARLG